MSGYWTLDDIDWSRFDRSKIDPDLLKIVKAASLVEHNGADYATYLCNVFHDDPAFCEAATQWAGEEIQHGQALAKWAEMADVSFDFGEAFASFTSGYSLPLDASESVRGSRAGELVARCIVETGTSSYYTALRDATEEPVLKQICGNIARDEIRHYKLFYSHLERYLETEKLGRLGRLRVALGRIGETEDDELSYAYYAANGRGERYDRKANAAAYMGRAWRYYQPRHMDHVIKLVFKAAGLNPNGRLKDVVSGLAYRFVRFQQYRALRAA